MTGGNSICLISAACGATTACAAALLRTTLQLLRQCPALKRCKAQVWSCPLGVDRRLCAVQGVVPEHFARASGGLIRHILQQLEEIGFVEKNPGSHGGRRITSQVGAWDRDTSR